MFNGKSRESLGLEVTKQHLDNTLGIGRTAGAKQTAMDRCFACDRKLGKTYKRADTRDDQIVAVGPDCYKKVVEAGEEGYRYPGIGPRLWVIKESPR